MTAPISNKIFNTKKTDYASPSLFLGQEPGLLDTVNKKYPAVFDLYKEMKSLDWDECEFNYTSCNAEFKSCDRSTYDMMIKTLAWQWEADSVASRSIIGVMAPLIGSSELFVAWQRVADNESVHGLTYSEIVRMSFDDPSVVLDEVLKVEESITRLSKVTEVMAKTHRIAHLYALGMVEDTQETYNAAFMFTVAMLVLERIQFMSSFAITFTICETGMFQPIGRAVQKIAQDELEVHVELDKAILRHEFTTERGKLAFEQCKDDIQALIDEGLVQELSFNDYLFSEGRSLVGFTPEIGKKWSAFNARDVYNFFRLQPSQYVLDLIPGKRLPATNPHRLMERWLNLGKLQGSPQEEKNPQYKVGVIQRDDDDVEFELDF
jgi:ribonucleoside-diphosphate reductase beta chain